MQNNIGQTYSIPLLSVNHSRSFCFGIADPRPRNTFKLIPSWKSVDFERKAHSLQSRNKLGITNHNPGPPFLFRASMNTLYPSVFCVSFLAAVIASPIPSVNGTESQSWVPGPAGRGTFDLLKTCIITLVLCVWTAIHPDVYLNLTPLTSFATKLCWMLYGLLLPEAVVAYALTQMILAVKLRKKWCTYFGVKPGSEEDLMGMRGAFLVIMGGVTLGPRDCFGAYPKILKAKKFMILVERGYVPRDFFDMRIIKDKSKADEIAKLVVCAQASWMVIQCVVRTAIGLPLSLLEFHVVVQVVCTMVMYGLWWYKPLNIHEPIPIIDYRQSEVLRFFYHEEFVVGVTDEEAEVGGPTTFPSKEFPSEESSFSEESPLLEASAPPSSEEYLIPRYPDAAWFEFIGNSSLTYLPDLSRVSLRTARLGGSPTTQHRFFISFLPPEQNSSVSQSSVKDIQELVQKAFHQKYKTDDMSFWNMLRDLCWWLRLPMAYQRSQLCTSRKHQLFSLLQGFLEGPFNVSERLSWPLPTAVSFTYGVSHSIVWNHQFLTEAEMWAWRISSIIVPVAICPVSLAFFSVEVFHVTLPDRVGMVIAGSAFALMALMPLAGLYFLIGSFISLRSLPDGVYQTIPLERYWPHF